MVWPTKDVGDISDILQIKGKDDVVYGVQEGDWLKLTRESGYILILKNHRCSVAGLTTAGAWKISVCCGGFRVCNNP